MAKPDRDATASAPATAPPLALSMLLVAEWFDRELRGRLEQDGWPRLSTNQSRLVAELDGRRTQADLARRLEVTRQSVHVIVRRLADLGLVGVAQPAGAVVLTDDGHRLAAAARGHLDDLERELQDGWSGGPVADLRATLAAYVAERADRRD